MRRLIGAIVLALASFGLAHAQETTSGSLTGQVVDAQGAAVPGATVSVASAQGTKTFITDSHGRFFAPYLTPGTYSVRVELSGFSPVEQRNVPVRLGQRLELSNLVLRVGGLEEVVEVVGSAPVVDMTSTTAGGVLDSEQLKGLPVGRNFTATLYLVPGVSDSSGVGDANPSIAGASGLDNNYIVDGVNITNAGFGGVGTYSIVFGSLGTGVTTDFIKETQVKTAGFEAEYGQSAGGVVNVVTKSGSNELNGSIFGYYSPDALEADWNEYQTVNGTVNTTGIENLDLGVSVGGPVVKDKLFFFGAFNPQWQTRTFIAPADAASFPLRSLGDVDRTRKVYSYAGKLTWQANQNHRFDFTAFGDPSRGDLGPQRFTALQAGDTGQYSSLEYGGDNQSLRYDGIISPSWLVEASISRAANDFVEFPSVDEHFFIDQTVSPNTIGGGIGLFDRASTGLNMQYSAKSTHLFEAGGNHQVRYGVQVEDIEFTRDQNRTGPSFTLHNGETTRGGGSMRILPAPEVAGGQIYRIVRAPYGPVPLTTQRYVNAFLQDTWQMGRLTVRPGIRWERQELDGGTPICFEGESRVGAVGHGVEEPTGPAIGCEYTWSNNWSPRLGATYDVTGDGRSKLYASYGRFYVKIPNDLAARALAADPGITRGDYYDRELTRPIPDGVLAAGTTTHFLESSAHAALFENDTKSTYTDEIAAGFEFEAARNLNVGLRYIRRDISTVLEDYAPVSPVDYFIPTPAGSGSVEYIIDNITAGLPTADSTALGVPRSSFEDPSHKYQAVELTANKTFSDNWSLIASYRWSQLKGNFEGFFRSDNGQSDPSITSLFDFPTNDPAWTQIGVPQFGFRGDIRYQGTVLGEGVLPNDRPHQVKLYGTYAAGPLNLGVGFNAGSGRSLTALAANPAYDNSGEIPETLRGEGIMTVDGFKERTDFETQLDLHADYGFKLSDRGRLVVMADVFNVLNDQDARNYDNYTELNFGVLNPDFGAPANGGASSATGYNAPRSVRFGARLEW